jgi:hypothetical protein
LTFNPYLYLEQTYTDNVRFTAEGESDTFTRMAAVFPVNYDLRRSGSIFASYQFFLDRFADFKDFDNEGQRFDLGYTVKPDQKSQFRIGGSYLERDDQGLLLSDLTEDLFLTPRLTRKVSRIGAAYRRQLAPTWSGRIGVSYANFDFDKVVDQQDDEVLTSVQSRHGFIYDLGIEKRLSDRTVTGLGYAFNDFILDPVVGDPQFNMEGFEEIHQLYWFLRHTVGPLWRLDTRLGGFDRSGIGSDGRPLDRQGATGRFAAFRRFRTTELELFAGYAPTTEELLRGTSTVTTIGAALRDITPGRWDWRVFTRAGRRNPSNSNEADIDILTVGGEVQWALQRKLTLRFKTLYSDQTSDDTFSDRSFFRASLALYWFPIGRTELAGAPAYPFADDF